MVMTTHELLDKAKGIVDRLDAEVILSDILACDRTKMLLDTNLRVNQKQAEKFEKCIKKRSEGYPAAYIIGKREFYSLDFYVTTDVLIPRPDTEILVEWGISKALERECKVLDLCCGSGCIGISIAHYAPNSKVTLADISEKALDIAKKNGEFNNTNINLRRIDILNEDLNEKFDLILSNPPYIETKAIKDLSVEVQNEPHIALDGGEDGLVFYREITKQAALSLNNGGYLGFEVGYGQAVDVSRLLEEYFDEIEVLKDLGGVSRVVLGRKK